MNAQGANRRGARPELIINPGSSVAIDLDEFTGDNLEITAEIAPGVFDLERYGVELARPARFRAELSRVGDDILAETAFEFELKLECARCLADMTMPVSAGFRLVFVPAVTPREEHAGEKDRRTGKPGGGPEEEPEEDEDYEFYAGGADDSDTVPYHGKKLEFFGPLHDRISLAVPIKPLCREECRGLCPVCGTDLNSGKCGCKTEEIDPRFAVLKKLRPAKDNATEDGPTKKKAVKKTERKK